LHLVYFNILFFRSNLPLNLGPPTPPAPFTNVHPQFPPDSITKSHFTPTSTSTHCPYKGDASYYTVTTNKTEIKDAAWYYPDPLPKMEKIKNYVAFYKTKGDIMVGVEEE
jgi:uncharacterized protein (DUF427 family)